MPHNSWTWVLEKSVASVTDNAHELIEELMSALDRMGWGGRDRFHIHMAVEEAIVNAIEHGNQRMPEKKVDVVFKLSPEKAWIRISDQGKGFDFQHLPDPTDEEHLEEPHGRGVMLMRELMSDVRYNKRGNAVEMLKIRSAEEQTPEE